ncbi:BBE domain-containing protein [Ktedonospora formicarum]|uniref:Berberine/berberine-like domain-containing protein n=1 Tax=Ktedonospora formicarum TaxID=2778364 RepID=A0A8J3MZ80_9CHLR|nr:BBE domain-containing protein [Ktedonospora formicarum]GHO50510.1 hypothetical protein KSX_86730 [Ktedonospora formicarum]
MGTDATAFAYSDKQAVVLLVNSGSGSSETRQSQVRMEHVWQALRTYADGAYANYLANEEVERVHEAYPPTTYARLAALKRHYDPTNMFHLNTNIVPATMEQ